MLKFNTQRDDDHAKSSNKARLSSIIRRRVAAAFGIGITPIVVRHNQRSNYTTQVYVEMMSKAEPVTSTDTSHKSGPLPMFLSNESFRIQGFGLTNIKERAHNNTTISLGKYFSELYTNRIASHIIGTVSGNIIKKTNCGESEMNVDQERSTAAVANTNHRAPLDCS